MSVAGIAAEAGTTRQALYRRWPTKASLAAAAVGFVDETKPVDATPDPFVDLVQELEDFSRGVSRPGRMSLVGTMLQESTAEKLLAGYRAHVVTPRRQRIRAIFERAQQLNVISREADLEIAVTMCTGSWYARALAGARPPADWPRRVAILVWRAVGGDPTS